jgi:hypothetical protein
MPEQPIEVLRRWATGEFYPIETRADGRDAFDDLAEQMTPRTDAWWQAFRALFGELRKNESFNLHLPLEVLFNLGGERLRGEVAQLAHHDPKIASAFWYAMEDLGLSADAYQLLGRKLTINAFVRHAPRIPSKGELFSPEWEDEWSVMAVWYLTHDDPDEAWAVALDLLPDSDDPAWPGLIGVFIIEDLWDEHGDAMIDRIEAEAAVNEKVRAALPITRWRVPAHLITRVAAAAGIDRWGSRPSDAG